MSTGKLGSNGTYGTTGPPGPSTYVQYLPAPFQGDELLGRFLGIFESILSPIEETIDGVAEALDPRLAPDAFLPWLVSWTGVELDEHWPLAAQRELIARAAVLHRWRGPPPASPWRCSRWAPSPCP